MINDDVIIVGEEIMECDMEIEDESPEASGMEEATPPPEPSTAISVAPPIPVPPTVADHGEGQKVNQPLPPTTRETVEEDDEPLPPGVEDDEPLPPGIEAASGPRETPPSVGIVAGKAASMSSREPGRNDKSTEQLGE